MTQKGDKFCVVRGKHSGASGEVFWVGESQYGGPLRVGIETFLSPINPKREKIFVNIVDGYNSTTVEKSEQDHWDGYDEDPEPREVNWGPGCHEDYGQPIHEDYRLDHPCDWG